MGKSGKSWERRLSGEGGGEVCVGFVESLSYDRRLYKYDIAGSIAHAHMLCGQGLISKAEFGEIKAGLFEISEEIAGGEFEFDAVCEDIHMAIEGALISKIGEAGKKLHTGRSRNDQVATDMRLWMRDEIEVVLTKITLLQRAFLKLARKYSESLMPGYTHLQRAQPVVIGSYILSFVEQLGRDYRRFKQCRKGLNVCPLGSGAVAGSTLGLDRQATSKELGFEDITYNSIDAVSDRDFCAEFIFDCSLLMTHLSRLAEDWIIYCSTEFGFITIDDAYCTSSSMMPQKKNPDMLELMRGKCGSVCGSLMAMLMLLKGQPSSYNRDLQEDKIHVFNAADVAGACLEMAAAIVGNTKFNVKEIEGGLDEGFLDATGLAEYLVKKGVAFREAHGIVGGLVAECEGSGKKLSDVGLEEFQGVCGKIEGDVYEHLGAGNVVKGYVSEGAAGVKQVAGQIEYWKNRLKEQ